jgi:hypothetical protein
MKYHSKLVQKALSDKHSFIEISYQDNSLLYIKTANLGVGKIMKKVQRPNSIHQLGIVDIVKEEGHLDKQLLITSYIKGEKPECTLIDLTSLKQMKVRCIENPIIDYVTTKSKNHVLQ